MLRHLMLNANIVLSRQQLLDAVWGPDFYGDDSVVATYISYLRRKIDNRPDAVPLIHTHRGFGYVLRAPRTLILPMTSSEPRRRWSLRAKLTALVMVTAAIALAAVDILLPLNLRSSLLSTRDATLTAVVSSVPTGRKFDLQTLLGDLDARTRCAARSAGRSCRRRARSSRRRRRPAAPAGSRTSRPTRRSASRPRSETPAAARPKYRILALPVALVDSAEPAYLVAWMSLADVDGHRVPTRVDRTADHRRAADPARRHRQRRDPPRAQAARGDGQRRRRDLQGRPGPPGRRRRPGDRGGPAGLRLQRHARRHLRPARRTPPQRGTAAPVPGRRVPRTAHPGGRRARLHRPVPGRARCRTMPRSTGPWSGWASSRGGWVRWSRTC